MPYWKFEEETALKKMLEEDKSLEEICKALRRSREAVILKATRLGLEIPEKCLEKNRDNKDVKSQATTTTPSLPAIKPRELITMKEMMETMLGALDRLQNPQGLSNLELKRCRAIVSCARVYMSMLEKFTEWTHFEQEMVDLHGQNLIIFKQLFQEAKDPAQRAEFERNIKEIEKTLEEDKKDYGYVPFRKKPNLITKGVDLP
jgi:hypothetical protein